MHIKISVGSTNNKSSGNVVSNSFVTQFVFNVRPVIYGKDPPWSLYSVWVRPTGSRLLILSVKTQYGPGKIPLYYEDQVGGWLVR